MNPTLPVPRRRTHRMPYVALIFEQSRRVIEKRFCGVSNLLSAPPPVSQKLPSSARLAGGLRRPESEEQRVNVVPRISSLVCV